ncbi:MAG: translation initiation factor IF-2 [Gammaproteobacteria bacterium]|nr:translation initiation factor IF-2 [Gammaproteobacteria bacterium]TVQ48426.1 MAG: translation initiation factor IF-2 [Gammaproteobacteria bacterium]
MADVTVAEFAATLKVPVEKLLSQLDEAGIKVAGAEDRITDDAKLELLSYLRRSHGRGEPELAAPRKITLKRKSHSELRVAADKGRARTVNVEVRKKRTYVKREALEAEAREKQDELEQQRRAELEAREAEARAEQDRREAEERARQEAEEEARRLAEEEEARKRAADDEARRVLAEQQAREQAEREREKERRKREAERESRNRAAKPERTLHVAGDKSGKRRKRKQAPERGRGGRVNVESRHGFERPTAPVVREVEVPETITVSELAQRMAVKGAEVIKVLMNMGAMVTINQPIDQDTAVLVVEEMGHTPKTMTETAIEDAFLEKVSAAVEGEPEPRPPVVTIMGHVDHGKTSLLDFIRRTRVAAGEAGGITQHVGAYSVGTPKGKVTFLDTPGHAAFTAMRARGAQVTDIVVLVVAANDGVMPQTVEAVEHAKAAGVPIIVAVNKMDLEDADPERVKSGLSQHGVIAEDWGGENLFVNVSAKQGTGIDELLDSILLQAEVLDLHAVAQGAAQGVVVESSLEKGRGAVATVLVQSGVLNVGDVLLAGRETGRVRAMFDESGKPVKQAGPSSPVVVLGLSGTPQAGDEVLVVTDERKAREVAEFRQSRERDVKLAQQQAAKLEDVFSQMTEGESAAVQLLIKADVHGSAEALRDAMTKLSSDEVRVKVISTGVGGITESDINLAAASQAIVIGFNVRADAAARQVIKDTGVDVRYYSIIYQAIDEVKAAISGLMMPEIRENIVGLAQVREVFSSPKFGDIAGSMVLEGYVRRALPIRVLRDNVVIYEGELESLRRFKDDVAEVRAGTECGIGVRNYNDVRPGDQIECYERIEVARSLQ